MIEYNAELLEKVKRLPSKPGVYLMKGKDGKIIYIGKAKNLKNRVSSYFQTANQYNEKVRALISKIETFDIVLTDNEIEALMLENNLIKKHRPYYNIELKDNERYPYIKITNERFPRIIKTRIKKDDKSYYFGPFPSVKSINNTIRTITDIFPLRRCNRKIDRQDYSPCLNYYLGKCKSPCSGKINEQDYNKMVKQVLLFLRGKGKKLIDIVEKEMQEAAKNYNYEHAIELRERLKAINSIMEEQKITSTSNANEDIIAIYDDGDTTHVSILVKRKGKIVGLKDFEYTAKMDKKDSFEQFLGLYYSDNYDIPDRIIIPFDITNRYTLSKFLSEKSEKVVKIDLSYYSNEKKLIEMAKKNALYKIRERTFKYNPENGLFLLGKILNLTSTPKTIEGFDIATLLGNFSVASMVKFIDGIPSKKNYRRYKIRYSNGQNDVEMMKEAVARRYQRLLNEKSKLPDIILIDGGLPQINAVKEVLDKLGIDKPVILGLAKKKEHIFRPGKSKPIILNKTNDSLKLLIAVRDEAHRFANSYHLKLRDKESLRSKLETIKGLGEKRIFSILRAIDNIESDIDLTKLESIPGIGKRYSQKIYKALKNGLK
ncbi:MAG: excinuclease ABC subunit C [Spirochaetes bacterium]|nr:MAG: excinuclease ABC subunit C [Spirochaetota bacterium]